MLKALRTSRSRSKLASDSVKQPTTPTRRSARKDNAARGNGATTVELPASTTTSPTKSRRWKPRPLSLVGAGMKSIGKDSSELDDSCSLSLRLSTPSLASDTSTISRSPYTSTSRNSSRRDLGSYASETTTAGFTAPESPLQLRPAAQAKLTPAAIDSSWAAMERAQHAAVRSALGLFVAAGSETSSPESLVLSPRSPAPKTAGSEQSSFMLTEDSVGCMLATSFPLPPARAPPPVPTESSDKAPDGKAQDVSLAPRRDPRFKGPVVTLSQVSDSSDLARRRRSARSKVGQADVPGLPTITSGDAACAAVDSMDSTASSRRAESSANDPFARRLTRLPRDQDNVGQPPRARFGSLPYLGHGKIRSPQASFRRPSLPPGGRPDPATLTLSRSSTPLTPVIKTAKTALPWLPYFKKPSSLFSGRGDKTERGAWSTPIRCVPLPEPPLPPVPSSAKAPSSAPDSSGCSHPAAMTGLAGSCATPPPPSLFITMAPAPERLESPASSSGFIKGASDEVPGLTSEGLKPRPESGAFERRSSLREKRLLRPSLGVRRISSSPSLRSVAPPASTEVKALLRSSPLANLPSPPSRVNPSAALPGSPAKPRHKLLIPPSMSFARLRSRFLGEEKVSPESSTPEQHQQQPMPSSVKARVRWYEKKAQESSSDSLWGTSRRIASLEMYVEMTEEPSAETHLRPRRERRSALPSLLLDEPQIARLRLSNSQLLPLGLSDACARGDVSISSMPSQSLVGEVTMSPSSSSTSMEIKTTLGDEGRTDCSATLPSSFERPSTPLPLEGYNLGAWADSLTTSEASRDAEAEQGPREAEPYQARLQLPLPPAQRPGMSFDSLWTMSSLASDQAFQDGPDLDVVPSNETDQFGLTLRRTRTMRGGGESEASSSH